MKNSIMIEGYPNYYVDDIGRVFSKSSGQYRELVQRDDRYGYPKVTVCKDGKKTTKNVHRLVAEAFVGGYSDGLQVNHINGNKHDNRADNLEWISGQDNRRHAYRTGLNHGPRKKVRIIETGETYNSEKECADAIGGCRSGVNHCVRGSRNSYKGFHYEYVD